MAQESDLQASWYREDCTYIVCVSHDCGLGAQDAYSTGCCLIPLSMMVMGVIRECAKLSEGLETLGLIECNKCGGGGGGQTSRRP